MGNAKAFGYAEPLSSLLTICPNQEKINAIAKSTHKRKKIIQTMLATQSVPDGPNPKVIAAAVVAAVQAWGRQKWSPTALDHPWWLAARSAILGLFVD